MAKRKRASDGNGAAPGLDIGDARDFLDQLWVSLGALLQVIDDANEDLPRLVREREDVKAEIGRQRAHLAEENRKVEQICQENRRRIAEEKGR